MQIIFKKTYSDPESRIIISKGTKCECEFFDDIYGIKLPPNIKKTNGDLLTYFILSEECFNKHCKKV